MFDDLSKFLGEKKTVKFLKGLVNNYKFKNITYVELSNFAEKIKKGGKKVLDSYVFGEKAI